MSAQEPQASNCSSINVDAEEEGERGVTEAGAEGTQHSYSIQSPVAVASSDHDDHVCQPHKLQQPQQRQQLHRDSPEIQKAIRFWTHPWLSTIPTKDKVDYLKSRGLSDADVHTVWETMTEVSQLNQLNQLNPHDRDNSLLPIQSKGHNPIGHSLFDTDFNADDPSAALVASDTMRSVPRSPYYDNPDTTTATAVPAIAHHHYENNDETPYTLALLSVGGLLGLSAAAAVRWLNGGDFALFPPAIAATTGKAPHTDLRTNTSAEQEAAGSNNGNINQDDYSDTDSHNHSQNSNDDDDDDDDDEQQQSHERNYKLLALSEQIRELANLVKNQSKTHQQLMERINGQQQLHTKQVTDQSMDMLKRSQYLMEIKLLLEQVTPDNVPVQQALDIVNRHLEDDKRDVSQRYQPTTVHDNEKEPSLQQHGTSTTDTTTQQKENHDDLSPSSILSLRNAIQRMTLETTNTTVEEFQSACQVLYLYVTHLCSNPHVPRYRKIQTSNPSFQKVQLVPGAVDLLLAVGFEPFEGCMQWKPDATKEQQEEALAMLQMASEALVILQNSAAAAAVPAPVPAVHTSSNSHSTNENNLPTLCEMALSALTQASHNDNAVSSEVILDTSFPMTMTTKTITEGTHLQSSSNPPTSAATDILDNTFPT